MDSREASGAYVFLSYSSADRGRALAIADTLEQHGIVVWVDRRSIAGGTSWSQEIVRGIESCAAVFLLCSATSMTSRNVRQEVQLAWEAERPILPLMIEPVQIAESIRYAVAGRQWLELFGRDEDAWVAHALQALSLLGVRPGVRAGTAVPGTRAEPESAWSQSATERRSVTILAVEFLTTGDDDALDPEDIALALLDAQETALQVVARFDGTSARVAHGLTAYFGFPASHEDDALRAVRTALEIVTAVDRLPHGHLKGCAAIHTGRVVVGAPGVSGDAPAIASSLLALCDPGTVITSAPTQRLVDGYVRTRDLGEQRVRGRSQLQHIFQVLGESGARTRLQVAAERGLAPLVGRETELSLLHDCWERTRDGEGQVVLLVGEPGIGKSRLSLRLRETVAEDAAAATSLLQCSAVHQQSPFYPVIELFERQVLDFGPQEEIAEKRGKVRAYLGELGLTQGDEAFVFSALLGLPPADDGPSPALTPERQRERTLDVLVSIVLARAEQQPVLLTCEDLHWADPSTLELLAMLVEYSPAVRLMLVVTSRPGIETTWLNRAHVSTVNLARLSDRQAGTLVDGMLAGWVLPDAIREEIIDRADGVPLFAEELTRSVIESGRLQEVDGRLELLGDASALRIPASLEELLLARLDRLGEAREVAQLGAVLGREFSFELLAAVAPWGESWLHHALARLTEADLVQQRRLRSQATYVFRHALVQDVAYDSLSRERRQEFHREIATTLVEQFPETYGSRPEIVARHFTEAGEIGRAIPFWLQAGQYALRNFANAEAISHLQRGLALLATTPDSVERMQTELGLQMTLGVALMTTRGFAAPDVQAAFQRGHELCQAFGDVPQLFPVLNGLWTYYVVRAELDTATRLAEQQLRLAEQANDDDFRLEARLNCGTTAYFTGNPEIARMHLERATALYDEARHSGHAYIYGHEPGSATLNYLAMSLGVLGYPDQALAQCRRGIELGTRINHPLSLARNLCEAAFLRRMRGEVEAACRQARESLDFATEHGVVIWMALSRIFFGWATAVLGEPAAGVGMLREGLAAFQATGARLGVPASLTCLAEALMIAGELEDAARAIESALELAEETGERFFNAESLRLQAEIQDRLGNPAEAERRRGEALGVAKAQTARYFELRVATDIAAGARSAGRTQEARELLEPLLNWFTEGLDTPVYVAARDVVSSITP